LGFEDPFEIAAKEDLAGRLLSLWDHSKTVLKEHFDVDAKIDAKVIQRVEIISKLFQSRPVQVTDELIKWANREE
jgi:hypothetical protein